MKCLLVFYSRTGRTKKIAELISTEMKCEYEEILDTKKRKGFIIGFINSGFAATREKLTIIKTIQKDPKLYDTVILGTPIWNKRMTPAIRTYITENKNRFKSVAFYCTMGGKGGPQTFESMRKLCEKTPVSTLAITKKEIKNKLHLDKIKNFSRQFMS
jgi:flavodoxin